MAGKSKGPWFWKSRGEWVVNIRGKRHYLGPAREQAYKDWHKLSAAPEKRVSADHVVAVMDAFLEFVKDDKPDSYEWYRERINQFAKTVPDLLVSHLKPLHVRAWVKTKKSDGHKRGCITAVMRAFNWATKEGHVEKNPLKGMEKPAAGRREVVITPDQFQQILLHSTERFRDLLNFAAETGCRPQEAFALEDRHLDMANRRCVFPEKESKGKKKKRVIYLTDQAFEIVSRLKQPGAIFRNEDGNRWHRNNVACRFARLAPKLGFKFRLYDFRHTWMTRMLKSGVDPITVAHLAGHNDVSQLARTYAHIENDTTHLQAALKKGASVPQV